MNEYKQIDVAIIGAGMIVHDLILPAGSVKALFDVRRSNAPGRREPVTPGETGLDGPFAQSRYERTSTMNGNVRENRGLSGAP